MRAFRGVTHLHSVYSRDGVLGLREIRDLLRERGYHFALMAEHEEDLDEAMLRGFIVECAALSDGDFLFVPGVEFHARCLAACGLNPSVEFRGDEARRLSTCLTENTFNVLVHVRRKRFLPAGEILEKVHAVEVWNVKADGGRYPALRRISLWKALRRRIDVHPVFALDLHEVGQLAPVHVRVELPELTTAAVLSAMKTGRYALYQGDREWRVDDLAAGLKARMLINGLVRTAAMAVRKAGGWALPRRLRKRARALLDGTGHE